MIPVWTFPHVKDHTAKTNPTNRDLWSQDQQARRRNRNRDRDRDRDQRRRITGTDYITDLIEGLIRINKDTDDLGTGINEPETAEKRGPCYADLDVDEGKEKGLNRDQSHNSETSKVFLLTLPATRRGETVITSKSERKQQRKQNTLNTERLEQRAMFSVSPMNFDVELKQPIQDNSPVAHATSKYIGSVSLATPLVHHGIGRQVVELPSGGQ